MEEVLFLVIVFALLVYKCTGDCVQRRNAEVREEFELSKYNQFFIHVTDYMFENKFGTPAFVNFIDDGMNVIDQGYQWTNISKDALDYCVYAAKQYEVVYDTEAIGSLPTSEGIYTFASYTLKPRRKEWAWKYWL